MVTPSPAPVSVQDVPNGVAQGVSKEGRTEKYLQPGGSKIRLDSEFRFLFFKIKSIVYKSKHQRFQHIIC